MPGWIWGLAGLCGGLAVAAYVYISRPVERAPADAPAAAVPGAKPAGNRAIPLPPKQPARFSFYEILPSYEVVIPRDSADPKSSKRPALAEPGSYVVQVGSFHERRQAEEQKAQLALLGVESRLEKVTIDNDQVWYRVRIGPEKDLARVHSIMTRLSENRVDSFLVHVRE